MLSAILHLRFCIIPIIVISFFGMGLSGSSYDPNRSFFFTDWSLTKIVTNLGSFRFWRDIHWSQTWVWLRVESLVDSESNASRLSWVDLNRKIGEHLESWVNLNQYFGNPLGSWVDSESILGIPLESELNRYKPSRYSLSHELIRIKALDECPKKVNEIEWKPKKMSTKLSETRKGQHQIEWRSKKVNEISSWIESLSYNSIFLSFWVMS